MFPMMHRLQMKHDGDGSGSEGWGKGGRGRAREGWVGLKRDGWSPVKTV